MGLYFQVHFFRDLAVSPAAFFARLSATAAISLFFVYGFTVASVALPFKLWDTPWQISVVNAIINNSTLPLEGVVLAHLAAYLDPSEPRLEAFCKNLRSWALPETLGFLLLIPLQTYSLAKGVYGYKKSAANCEIAVTQNFANLRNAVRAEENLVQLQKSLINLKGPIASRLKPAVSCAAPEPVVIQAHQYRQNS